MKINDLILASAQFWRKMHCKTKINIVTIHFKDDCGCSLLHFENDVMDTGI